MSRPLDLLGGRGRLFPLRRVPMDEGMIRPRLLGRPCPNCKHSEHAHDGVGCMANTGNSKKTDGCRCRVPNGRK